MCEVTYNALQWRFRSQCKSILATLTVNVANLESKITLS